MKKILIFSFLFFISFSLVSDSFSESLDSLIGRVVEIHYTDGEETFRASGRLTEVNDFGVIVDPVLGDPIFINKDYIISIQIM